MQLLADITFGALVLVCILALASPHYRRLCAAILLTGALNVLARAVIGPSIELGYVMATLDVAGGLAIVFLFQRKPRTAWLNFGPLRAVCGLGAIQGLFSIAHLTMTLSVVYKTPTLFYDNYELILFGLQLLAIFILYGGLKHAWQYWVGGLKNYTRDSNLASRAIPAGARYKENLP